VQSTNGVHSTPSQDDDGSGSRHARIAHTAIAVLVAGSLLYVAPSTATAHSSPPAKTAISPAGTSGSGYAGPQLVTAPVSEPAFAITAASKADSVAADGIAGAPAPGSNARGSNASAQPASAQPAAAPAGVSTASAQPAASASPASSPSPDKTTRSFNLYDPRAERWQNPDKTACTAASTLSMLNTIAHAGAPAGFVWTPSTAYARQETILSYERRHMTMAKTSAGADPHGWRNALNYFGWGSTTAGVYEDESFSTFAAAAKRAVSALATTRKPVGILARMGKHAQFITGYKVTGADPASGSTDFTVIGVYLTDPWLAAGHRDTYVTYAQWHTGGKWLRFSQYLQSDSIRKDAIDGHVGKTEWYGKWVIVAPVR
jgi:hypothetical protein